MKNSKSFQKREVLRSITRDRTRTNLLRKYEQSLLAFLVQRVPSRISSNMLTGFGLFGSVVVLIGFILAYYINRNFLLLGVLGFFISWFGDSLDGRVAYFRNIPRKLYGFTLDISIDWIGIIMVGCGYIIYSDGIWEILGYGFVVLYGWEMIIALMKYKITGKYSIDSGLLGPTEVRIIISAILVAEVIHRGSIIYSSVVIVAVLIFVNILDTRKLLRIADELDKEKKMAEVHAEMAEV